MMRGTISTHTPYPVPGLCLLCKSYDDTDQEENMLCMMNRYDQRNKRDFVCGAYERKY